MKKSAAPPVESVTENLCAAVILAGGIVDAYQKSPGKLHELDRASVAQQWELLCGIVESGNIDVLSDRFRCMYEAGPPEPVAGVSGASFHEQGLALVSVIYHGIFFALGAQEAWNKAGGKGDVPVASVEDYLRNRAPRFDSGRLIACIRDEATRADRVYRKPQNAPLNPPIRGFAAAAPPAETQTGRDESDYVWFNATEAARYIGTTSKTITTWIREGTLKYYAENGTKYKFLKSELDTKKAGFKPRKSRKTGN